MIAEKWALVSVYDKTGIKEDVRRLVKMGWSIISSGGTAKVLAEAGIAVTDVAELVGGGAILGHRVVTLSREVHAALLADALKPEQLAELVEKEIPFIDLVRCDFYPLRDAIADPKATIDSVVETTDIGGPCMVRSGAKGLRIVVCRKPDMLWVLDELENAGDISLENRQKLRARAEFEVTKYTLDSATFHGAGQFQGFVGERISVPAYGENAWQTPAGLYTTGTDDSLALENFKVIEGSEPSYNNLCDLDRLLQVLTHVCAVWQKNQWQIPSIVVGVKHGNSCCVAVGDIDNLLETMGRAITGDTRAIFGGLVICNFEVTGAIAEAMINFGMSEGITQKFDGVIAPRFDDNAIEVLTRKKGKCRIIVNSQIFSAQQTLDTAPRFRQVRGGFLIQPNYTFVPDFSNDPEMVRFGGMSASQAKNLALGWAIGAHSNSNTVTITANNRLLGNGVGQQDRVGAAELAIKRAVDAGHKAELQGASAYSDSFFPQIDAVEVLIRAGIESIFSTSGSINDRAVRELCMTNGVTLVQLPDKKARGFFGH